MAKIYVDTNRLIDFYRAAPGKCIQLEELEKQKRYLVLTEQTITEFRRNRVGELTRLKKAFQTEHHLVNAGILQQLPEYKELEKTYQRKRPQILEYLKELIDDEKKDSVAQAILALSQDSAVKCFKLNQAVIATAHRRKLLGNPPSSPDKYTVGDEVIWEVLLANVKEDLIIVTDDETYPENFPLLAEEYHQRTKRKLLLVTERFDHALKAIGQTPTPDLVEAEEEEERSRKQIEVRLSDEMERMWDYWAYDLASDKRISTASRAPSYILRSVKENKPKD